MALTLLLISLLAYALGPVLYALADRARSSLAALDGFVMIAVSGLALVHIIPHAVATGGPWAILVAGAGFIGPGLVEHRLERAAKQTHTAAMVVALAGLTIHEFFDGVGLAGAFYGQDGVSLLAVAVILHRLPIAITIWWLLAPTRGPRAAGLVLVALGAATVLGYFSVDVVAGIIEANWLGLLEALIAGSLLHVVVHRPSPLSTPGQGHRERLAAGVGALLGLGAVIALGGEHYIPHHGHDALDFADVFMGLALESAPPLLLAFGLAGLLPVILPQASLRWLRTGRPASEAARGVAFGIPLAVCSCGVVPLYQTLVLQGVPATAGMAFLVATPELGIDSVLISLPLLGLDFTIVRLVCAAAVAVAVGAVVGRLAQDRPVPAAPVAAVRAPDGLIGKLRAGLRFGFAEIVDHTSPWILLGLAVAAVAEPALKGDWITALPWGFDVAIFAFLGMPLYVCASGATPFVAVLIHNGVSPGAALAFLLTGPATNVTTFGILSKLHGRRVAILFGAMMAGLTIGLGLAINLALPELSGIAVHAAAVHEPGLLQVLSLAGLTLVLALSVLRQGPRGFVGQILTPFGEADDHHDHDHDHDH